MKKNEEKGGGKMKNEEIIFIVEEDVDGGYVARALEYGIFTEGDSLEELKQNIRDAMECYFDREEDIPKIIHLHIVKDEVMEWRKVGEE